MRLSPKVLIGICCLLAACDENLVFDRNLAMPDKEWHWKQKAEFQTEILDTTQWYSMVINVRITDEYPYNNLWVLMHAISPEGDTSAARIELQLFAEDGHPLGKNRGTVIEYRIPAIERMDFSRSGKWTFTLEHNMRVNTLPGILDIGMAVTKTGEKF